MTDTIIKVRGGSSSQLQRATHVGVQTETVNVPNFAYGLTPTGMIGWDPNSLLPASAKLIKIEVYATITTDVTIDITDGGSGSEFWYGANPYQVFPPNHHDLVIYRGSDATEICRVSENIPDYHVVLAPNQHVVHLITPDPHPTPNAHIATITDPVTLAEFTHTGSVPLYYNRIFINQSVEAGTLASFTQTDNGEGLFTMNFIYTTGS